jgi:hypothetical protein
MSVNQLERMSDREVVEELQRDTPLNRARACV